VHPLWFYKHQHDNRVCSKLFVACQRWWFQWRFWFVPSVPGYLREEEAHKPGPWRNPIERNHMGLHLENEVARRVKPWQSFLKTLYNPLYRNGATDEGPLWIQFLWTTLIKFPNAFYMHCFVISVFFYSINICTKTHSICLIFSSLIFVTNWYSHCTKWVSNLLHCAHWQQKLHIQRLTLWQPSRNIAGHRYRGHLHTISKVQGKQEWMEPKRKCQILVYADNVNLQVKHKYHTQNTEAPWSSNTGLKHKIKYMSLLFTTVHNKIITNIQLTMF